MNSKKRILTISIIIVMLLIAASPATANAPGEAFTVISTQTGVVDPGIYNIHGNHLRAMGMVSVYETCWTFIGDGETSCHREIVTANVVLSLDDMTGPMWGSFVYLDENDKVTWEGTFIGDRALVNGDVISTIHDVIGRGSGQYEGLLFRYTIQAVNAGPGNPVPFTGTGSLQTTGNYNP